MKQPAHKWKRKRVRGAWKEDPRLIQQWLEWRCIMCYYSTTLAPGKIPDGSKLPNCHEAVVKQVLEE